VSKDKLHSQLSFSSKGLEDTKIIGKKIADNLVFPSCVYLDGAMGVGKTTLSKSIIEGFGYVGEVTSPTYNLVQEYSTNEGTVYHMDLYRLEDPSELEFLALEDLWSETSLFLIEWPERGGLYLPKADVEIALAKTMDGDVTCRHIDMKLYT
jgi:tRNA threonylcarbamoyladenosine biosynthesis protein TsaE